MKLSNTKFNRDNARVQTYAWNYYRPEYFLEFG